jgi:hypothetical protein
MEDSHHSAHAGVYSAMHNVDVFSRVRSEFGVLNWPGHTDPAAEALYSAIRAGVYGPAESQDQDKSSSNRA